MIIFTKLRYSAVINMFHRRCKHYRYNYNSKVEDLLNCQIMAEQQAAQEYLNLAVTFLHPSKCQVGTGGLFMKMYEEEMKHMFDCIHYQILRGGKPLITGLQTPTEHKNLTLLEAFTQSLTMEKEITKQIEECIKVAEELNDIQCADFFTTVFLHEQLHSIHEMSNHVTKLSQLKNNEHALYLYDLALAKKYPYSIKDKCKCK